MRVVTVIAKFTTGTSSNDDEEAEKQVVKLLLEKLHENNTAKQNLRNKL